MLLDVLKDSGVESVVDGDTRAEIVRAFGQRRASDFVFLETAGHLVVADPDLMVRRECAIALGRSGDARCVWNLVQGLDATDDLFVRFAIRQAIRALPCDWNRLIDITSRHTSPRTKSDIALALRELYDVDLVRALAHVIPDSHGDDAFRKIGGIDEETALELLAAVHRKTPPWDGKWWQTQPAKSPPPAKTEAWEGTGIVVAAIERLLADRNPSLATLQAVREVREPALVPKVRELLASVEITDEVRIAAIETLFAIEGDASLDHLAPFLESTSADVRIAAVNAFGASGLKSVTTVLAPRMNDRAAHDAALAALARHPDPLALNHYLAGLEGTGAIRDACRSALVALRAEVRGALEAMQTRGALTPTQLNEARDLYSIPTPLLTWNLLGPFERAFHLEALESAPPERVLPILLAPVNGKNGTPLQAHDAPAALPDGVVDLLAQIGKENEVCAYAVARLESPVARTARLWVGSDDGVWIWVNGAKVLERAVDRGWTPDEDKLEVKLAAGVNAIVLRVDNAGGDWRFNVKVSEPSSGPLFEGMAAPLAARPDGEPEFDAQVWRTYALEHAGDPARGKELFYAEKGPGCCKCHAIAGVGPKVGPDLRDVGAKYPRAELITSVLEPSNRILDGFQATNFFLKSGDVVTGLVTLEKEGVVTVVDANAVAHELRAAEISERRVSKISAMATGVIEPLTREQFADLIAWIESLKK
jgi:putative heme-binding domain-containing protein